MRTTPEHPRDEAGGSSARQFIQKWSIEHPYVVIAFYLGVIIFGILVIGFQMPRRFMPYVQSPMVGVVTMMPGLSAREMELYISKPIEEQLVNVQNLRYIRSTSQDGVSIVSLEFWYGTDMKKALFDVQALMNIIQSNLPATTANLKPSWVLPIDPLNIPVVTLGLTGDKRWDWMSLRQFAGNEVVNRLKTVQDVYSVVPFGGYVRQMQVIVDRNKLASYGLSILDVQRTIDNYNVNAPAGTLTSGPNESIVRIQSLAQTPQDIMNYPIVGASAAPNVSGMDGPAGDIPGSSGGVNPAALRLPRTVYIRDVARVENTYWEQRSAYNYYLNGKLKPAIEVSVIQNPAASSYTVVPAVMKVVRQLEEENPGIKFQVAYDNSEFVGILFDNMLHELGIAILLTGIAVLLFLGEWRGALISLVTLPICLCLAVIGLVPLGMTLNSGTLIGLLLSIGRLVDDSIIDIHSVERHMRMGKDPKTATIDGIGEVRLVVISSTIMLVLALSPLLFSGGIVQLMFVELVWPIILALVGSMLVSFTLTAVLCANLLRPEDQRLKERESWPYRHILGPFQNFLDRLETGYSNIIRWMLQHRFTNLARILVTVIIGFAFYNFIGSEMMPLADVGQAYGLLEMQPGASFTETQRATQAVERILARYPEVKKISTEIGAESSFESFSPFYTGYAMPQVNSATMMITLSDKTQRKQTIWDIIDGAQREALHTIPGIRRLQIKEMGADVMASSQAPIALLIYGPDLNTLARLGKEVAEVAKHTPGAYQVATDWDMSKPSWTIKVDPVRAAAVGLSPEQVAMQAYYAMHGGLTTEFLRLPNLRQDTILVRYQHDQRESQVDLGNMYIAAPGGREIPLKAIADIQFQQTPTVIEHDGLRRVISVLAYYRKGHAPSMEVAMDIMMRSFSQVSFPRGYGMEIRGDMTQMMDSFRRLLIGLAIAIVFIVLVLVAQFRGFLQPLQMLFSLPLELSGVFIALWLAHQAFSTVSIMAIIVLTGMDITTAILLIDLIMTYRDRGVPRDQAVIEACPQRLRPILMTSIITIMVMIPVALFPKTGMDAYQPLGTVILGGLTVGTILSLFDIPIMHTYIDDLVKFLNRWFMKREWEWPVTEHADDQQPKPEGGAE